MDSAVGDYSADVSRGIAGGALDMPPLFAISDNSVVRETFAIYPHPAAHTCDEFVTTWKPHKQIHFVRTERHFEAALQLAPNFAPSAAGPNEVLGRRGIGSGRRSQNRRSMSRAGRSM